MLKATRNNIFTTGLVFSLANACGGDIKEETIVETGTNAPSIVANAPVVHVDTDPYVIPGSLNQDNATPIGERLPDPNSSLSQFGFVDYSGDPQVQDSVYNNLADGASLSRFRDSLYVLDATGLRSYYDGELAQAFLTDLRSDLSSVLQRARKEITDSTLRDLSELVVRSFYDGIGLDVQAIFLAEEYSDSGSRKYMLFDRKEDLGDGSVNQVLSLRHMPNTYDNLVRRINEDYANAFGDE